MTTDILKNVWYVLALSSEVPLNKMKTFILAGEPIVLVRKKKGELFAVKDICPHRGIPLSYGQIVEDEVECPYHGWKFNSEGVCTQIPSLYDGQELDCRKIKVKNYPVIEKQGLIWVFLADKEKSVESHQAPEPPTLKTLPLNAKPGIVEQALFPCHIDHAVIGLMDPAHGPYVHKSWFWRSSKSSYEKKKLFKPIPFGFQMAKHQPSKNSKAYKILGGQPTTEISFSIPGVRVEDIQIGDQHVYNLTALSPISDKQTRVISLLFWEMPWLSVIKPFVKAFAHKFLYQDLKAVSQQQDGLKYDPNLMLIRDADTQAKWYYALKSEWINHLSEKRAFQNPVKESELKWKS